MKISKVNSDLFAKFTNASFYFGSSVINLILSLLTFPIYATYLSAEDFGLLGYFNSIQGFLTPAFNLGMPSYILMIYFHNTSLRNKQILFNVIFYLSICNVFLSLLFLGIGHFSFNLFKITYSFFPYSFFILSVALFEPYKMLLLQQFRIRKESKKYFLHATLAPILNAGFSLIFLIIFKLGIIGRMGGIGLSAITSGLIYIITLRKFIIINFSFGTFKNAIKTIFPLLLASYAYIPIETIDKIILERLNMPEKLGHYSIGLQLSNFFLIAVTSLFKAYEPDIFKLTISNHRKKLIKDIVQFLFIISVGFIIFFLSQNFIVSILTRGKFPEVIYYSRYLSIAKYLSGICLIFNAIILAKQKVTKSAIVVYISSLTAIISYSLLIYFLDFNGAIIARIIVPFVTILVSIIYILSLKKNT